MAADGTDQLWIRQDNRVVTSYYHLTVGEMRMIWEIASRIRPEDVDLTVHRFTLSELSEIVGSNLTFAEAEALIMRLWRRELHVQSPDGQRRQSYRWITSAERRADENLFTVGLEPALKPFFLSLQEWVQASREQLRQFSSEYSARIYLWACAVRNKRDRTWKMTIEELRARLGIGPDEYPRFSSLKARVLDPPIKEINTRSDFRIAYRVERNGKAAVAVHFALEEGPTTKGENGAEVAKRVKARRAKARAAAAAPASSPKAPVDREEAARRMSEMKTALASGNPTES